MNKGVFKTGNWGGIGQKFARLDEQLSAARTRALMRIALRAEEIAVSIMEKQPSEWAELSEKYAAWKAKNKRSPLILHSTSSYRQKITAWTKGDTAYAGVKKGAKNKDGEDLVNIAAVLEFGSQARNIPGRPLWQPTLRELKKWLIGKDVLKTEILKALRDFKN